jgi:phosphoribosylanthranilate isomerase
VISIHRTRIKICGITRVADALAAANAGADAVGLVFFEGSPRAVSIAQAREICVALPPFVSTVALLVNASTDLVHEVCEAINPDLLQFHGDEDERTCRQFGRNYLKAIRVKPEMRAADLLQLRGEFGSAKALLLDTFHAAQYGGTGASFDWQVIPEELRASIVLSGGLVPDTVGRAVRTIRPWAVDVSSGVEQAKGIKDSAKIASFISAVRESDMHVSQSAIRGNSHADVRSS